MEQPTATTTAATAPQVVPLPVIKQSPVTRKDGLGREHTVPGIGKVWVFGRDPNDFAGFAGGEVPTMCKLLPSGGLLPSDWIVVSYEYRV